MESHIPGLLCPRTQLPLPPLFYLPCAFSLGGLSGQALLSREGPIGQGQEEAGALLPLGSDSPGSGTTCD